MTLFIFVLVVLLAAAFAFINGFRDVSTSVALAVRTRALTPTIAVLLAALFNLIGALLSAGLAVAISQNWVALPAGNSGLTIIARRPRQCVRLGYFPVVAGRSLLLHACPGGRTGRRRNRQRRWWAATRWAAWTSHSSSRWSSPWSFRQLSPSSPPTCWSFPSLGCALHPAERGQQAVQGGAVDRRRRRRLWPRAAGRPARQCGPAPGAAGGRLSDGGDVPMWVALLPRSCSRWGRCSAAGASPTPLATG